MKEEPAQRGRPPKDFTDREKRLVVELLSHGETPGSVAKMCGVSENTIRKYCPEEIRFGYAETYAKIAKNLAQRAMSDSKEAIPAAIFWLKTRARWREKVEETLPNVYIYSSPRVEGESIEEWLEKHKPEPLEWRERKAR